MKSYKALVKREIVCGIECYTGRVVNPAGETIYTTKAWSHAGALTQIRRWWANKGDTTWLQH